MIVDPTLITLAISIVCVAVYTIARTLNKYRYYKRLARFPVKNPNPLFQINDSCNIIYENQATKELLPQLATLKDQHPILNNIEPLLIKVTESKKPLTRKVNYNNTIFEQTIAPFVVGADKAFTIYCYDITNIEEAKNAMEKARDKADEANRAKSDFLANMSHELRTPMNGIMGMSELLSFSELNKEQLHYNSLIYTSAESLLYIVNDILDLSKIEVGELTIEPTAINIKDAASSAIDLLKPLANEKGLELNFVMNSSVCPHVNADKGRVQQIIRNLVSNAIKFTEDGAVTVTLDKDSTNTNYQLSVTDTGIGIPESHLSYIFGKFTQVSGSYSRKYGGTGLGLAITKNLVEMMHGTIEVTSIENQGSTFTCTIPLEETPEAKEIIDIFDKKSSNQTNKLNHDATILLVEDNEINQILAIKLLRKLGATSIDVANNGIEAISYYNENSYDIILMDCQMPLMNGFEATTEIRELEQTNQTHTPIIAITANAMAGDRENCLKQGMDDYLSKPITIDKLATAIFNWLPEHKKQEELQQEQQAPQTSSQSYSVVTPTNQCPVDMEHLAMFSDGCYDDEKMLFDLFVQQGSQNLDELIESFNQQNWNLWHELAHKLKGSAANLGAKELADTCFKIEETTEISTSDKKELLDATIKQFEIVKQFAQNY